MLSAKIPGFAAYQYLIFLKNRQDFKCMFCGALLEEDVTCRILAGTNAIIRIDKND